MAHAGVDTGGSQFFICLDRSATAPLDGKHTVFGRVIKGLDVLNDLSRNYTSIRKIPDADTDVIKSMTIVRKREHEYVPVTTPKDDEEPESTENEETTEKEESMEKEPEAKSSEAEDEAAAEKEESESSSEEGSDDK